jgi:hypothetical protein
VHENSDASTILPVYRAIEQAKKKVLNRKHWIQRDSNPHLLQAGATIAEPDAPWVVRRLSGLDHVSWTNRVSSKLLSIYMLECCNRGHWWNEKTGYSTTQNRKVRTYQEAYTNVLFKRGMR